MKVEHKLMMTRESLLRAALCGIEHQKTEIEAELAEIRNKHLPKSAPADNVVDVSSHVGRGAAPKKKRTMSAEARKRIADATRKRWAAYRKQNKAAKKTA